MQNRNREPIDTAFGDGASATVMPASEWRAGLPTLCGEGLRLREPTMADAERLSTLVTPDAVWRFTPRAPASTAGWTHFVQRLLRDRSAGLGVCYAVTREQAPEDVGLILVRRLELDFKIAECHFLFSESAWRSALPTTSVGYVLDFAFLDIGLHRLEVRSLTSIEDGVLRSLGCVAEGLLREACPLPGGLADQTIWSMLRADWLSNSPPSPHRGPPGSQPGEAAVATEDADKRDPLPAWASALPVLTGPMVTLREIDSRDGEALLRVLDPAEVEVCIEPPPTTVEMFQHYVAWARRQRAGGRVVSFSIFADGSPDPVGLLQVRSRDPRFAVAEWGMVLSPAYRGSGAFGEVIRLITPFVFDTIGAHRLEARTSAMNPAAIGSLRRLGAVKEACLRRSFLKHGEYQDDELWAVVDSDWRRSCGDIRPAV